MGEGDKIHEAICVNLFFMNNPAGTKGTLGTPYNFCLLYTSDAADE